MNNIRHIMLAWMLLLASTFLSAQTHDAAAFTVSTVTPELHARMLKGGSIKKNSTIDISQLRYLTILHYNYQGQVKRGEIVCNKAIAQDLIEIFRELYRNKYQIERVELIDNFGADDQRSMSANNTSSFCYRTTSGTGKLSKHARGMAIDINTQDNPYVRHSATGKTIVEPNTAKARQYANRTPKKPHMIDHNDLCYKLFRQHGFRWGGDWKHSKDYQHFEK